MSDFTRKLLDRAYAMRGVTPPAAPSVPRMGLPGIGGPDDMSPLERMRARMGLPTDNTVHAPVGFEGLPEAPGPVMGALRGLASALEPLALPQDAFFAVLAGAADPNTTITERMSRIEIKDYLPGGEAPERPSSGEEIFTLLGMDSTAAKWAGLGADILVDPLVFGSWLRVAGKVSKVESLTRLGDRVDNFISPIGMGREVNRVLRKSNTISKWQDARMERVLGAIRDPESVVLGIHRFGERATNALEWVVPRDAMLRLRLGDESGMAIFRAEQQARSAGMRVSREALELLQRAKVGPMGDTSQRMVRSLVQSMEGQSDAWERHLSSVTNKLERDFIEASSYMLSARQAGDRQVAMSFLTALEPEDIADPVMRQLSERLRTALDSGFDEFTDLEGISDMLIGATRRTLDDDVAMARTHLGELVEGRMRREGLSDAATIDEKRRLLGVFDNYLKETIFIDARMNLELSGYNFVADSLRTRVFELTEDLDRVEPIFSRILARGMAQGDAGIEDLMDRSTGIPLRDALTDLQTDSSKRMERMLVAHEAAKNTLERVRAAESGFADQIKDMRQAIKAADEALPARESRLRALAARRQELITGRFEQEAASRRAVLLGGTDDLIEYARVYVDQFRDLRAKLDGYTTPSGAKLASLKRRILSTSKALDDDVARYSAAVARVTEAPADKLTKGLLAQVINAETKLIETFRRQAGIFDEVIDTVGRPRTARQGPAFRRATTTLEEVPGPALPKPTPAVRKMLEALDSSPSARIEVTDGKARVLVGEREVWVGSTQTVNRAAQSGWVDNFTGSATDGRRAPVFLTSEGQTVARGRAAPSTLRAVRESVPEARDVVQDSGAIGRVDPALAEMLFGAPSDLYDDLNLLRRFSDELRLKLEDALTSKTTVPEAVEAAAAETAQRVRNLSAEVRRVADANREARKTAKAAENEAIKEARDAWNAQSAAEAAVLGVKRLGGTAHLRREAGKAIKDYGPIGRAPRADAMAAGRNTTKDEIVAARIAEFHDMVKAGKAADEDYAEWISRDVTFRELLGGAADMQALPLGSYLQGLMNGHMRRAFGLFIDESSFDRYIDKLRNGSILMGNVLDEDDLLSNLSGFEREADLIRGYHNVLKSAGAGRVLRRDAIAEHLLNEGVSGPRVNQVLESLYRSMSDSRTFQNNIDLVKEYTDRYQQSARSIRAGMADKDKALRVTNRQLFEEQETLNNQVMTLLGDYAMSSMSVLESAQVVNRVLPRQRYFEEALKAATSRGLVKAEKFTDQYGAVYRRVGTVDNAIGGFGGKYVHPYLYKELQRAAQVKPEWVPAAFTRMRSLITGGYLASPSVLAANFAGGLYQGATYGISPVTMLRRMNEVSLDLRKSSRGDYSAFMEEVGKNLDLNITSLVGNLDEGALQRLIRHEAGVGPDGIAGFLDSFASRYEQFLQRPMRMRWAGLEGFQFTEDWFKVATYKEMKERVLRDGVPGPRGVRAKVTEHQAQQIAAEAARNVVFDYSTLPNSLDFLKKTGILMFPGFPYFIAGRTLQAALTRPGAVAMADRLSEAMANMSLTLEEQAVLFLSESDWLRADQGVPLPGAVWEREDGSKNVSVIPFAQLVPTTTVWDSLFSGDFVQSSNPWAESITGLGMWGPIIDVITAISTGSGEEVPFSGRYGHVAFDAGAEGGEKAAQIFRFLYNTMAPSVIRKGLSVDYQNRAQGFVPSVYRMFASLGQNTPDDLLAGVYSVEERRTGRPDKTWREGVVSTFLRTPQVIALDGPLGGIRTEMQRERTQINDQLAALKRRYNRARASGDTATAESLLGRMNVVRNEFNTKWAEFLEFYSAYARQQQGR